MRSGVRLTRLLSPLNSLNSLNSLSLTSTASASTTPSSLPFASIIINTSSGACDWRRYQHGATMMAATANATATATATPATTTAITSTTPTTRAISTPLCAASSPPLISSMSLSLTRSFGATPVAASSASASPSTASPPSTRAVIEIVTPKAPPIRAEYKAAEGEDKDLAYIRSLITAHPKFPKDNIVFQDIFPVFLDPLATEMLFTRLTYHLQTSFPKIDLIVGLDSRGFIMGPTIATRLKAGFVPIRKAGKLPGECIRVAFTKEYGGDAFEIQRASIRRGAKCVIIDDLLATGGTLIGAIQLVEELGGEVLESLVVMELSDLNGRARVPSKVHSLLRY